MNRLSETGISLRKLRLVLVLFFTALAIPTGVLIGKSYNDLKWEAFHQHRLLAEELAARINTRLINTLRREDARLFTDFAFLNVSGDAVNNIVLRSPLARYPVTSDIPGLIGYFQVDAGGAFSTPLLPTESAEYTAYGLSADETQQRLLLQNRILEILSDNQLVQNAPPATETAALRVQTPTPKARSTAQVRKDARTEPSTGSSAESDSLVTGSGSSADSAPGIAFSDDADVSTFDSDASMPAPPVETRSAGDIAEEMSAQAGFDQLAQRSYEAPQARSKSYGRVTDLNLEEAYEEEVRALRKKQEAERTVTESKRMSRQRLEVGALPAEPDSKASGAVRLNTFSSEIDPFEFSLLDSGHFVLYRNVWRNGQRYIQGAVIDQQVFLRDAIEPLFRETSLSGMSDLIVAWQGDVFAAFKGHDSGEYLSRTGSATAFEGTLLYQTHLSLPLSNLELIFSINQLPAGPGAVMITWITLVLGVVLCGGFILMYRLGARQIELSKKQQDFVSAVSHELKTPLTSIRMYSEMLREGWASEKKKGDYYDFIYFESERLSRLISNVLQLARLSRNRLKVDLKPVTVSSLVDGIRSSVSSQMERAGFVLKLNCPEPDANMVLTVDVDYFTQMLINLVDNALKFAAGADNRTVEISCRKLGSGQIQFSVRDYGPGIAKNQIKKIFRLFYRPENELTRETVGTGIGLALVRQLAQAMNAQVDVVNVEPGAEFRIVFNTADS